MSSNTFVYFSSSDDEVAAISDSWQSCWGLQIDCVKALIKYFESRPELFLIIRVHPNQGLRARQDKAKWKSLRTTSKNVVIYNYDSKVNSYDLMSKAVAVFTYGSTIGVEAAYLRKPAALLAPARWDQLIPHKYLQSHLELDDWVSSVINRSSNIYESLNECYDGSIKWAHYMVSAGAPWSKIQVKKDFRKVNLGYLGGKSLKPKLMIILVSRLFKWLHFCLFEYGNFVKFPSR
jgi:hypothetical protein